MKEETLEQVSQEHDEVFQDELGRLKPKNYVHPSAHRMHDNSLSLLLSVPKHIAS